MNDCYKVCQPAQDYARMKQSLFIKGDDTFVAVGSLPSPHHFHERPKMNSAYNVKTFSRNKKKEEYPNGKILFDLVISSQSRKYKNC